MNKGGGSKKTIAGIIVLIIAIVAVVGGTTLYERRQLRAQRTELENLESQLQPNHWSDYNTVMLDSELYGFDHRIESYLFIGTDADTKVTKLDSEYHSVMADFILLMVMDHTDDSYGFIQLDRNTITPVDELTKDGKVVATRDLQLCTAQWYGLSAEMGAENTVNAVRNLLGELETIDGYYEISMKDIAALNHAVGGVQIHFDEDLTAADPAFKKDATVTLSDDQAEAFLRARMNVGQGTNVERMGRQRQYIEGLFAKVREHVQDNPKYGLELWKTLRGIAVTNMIGNDFSRIAQKLLKGEDKGILRLEGKTKTGTVLGDGLKHEEFYPSTKSIIKSMTKLYSLVVADIGITDDEEEEEDEEDDETVNPVEEIEELEENEELEDEEEDEEAEEDEEGEGEIEEDKAEESKAEESKTEEDEAPVKEQAKSEGATPTP